MIVYLDNVIVSGKVRSDLNVVEMAAVEKMMIAEQQGRLKTVTSRETWREQDRTHDSILRSQLQKDRDSTPVVTNDHKLLGFHFQQDPYGGFVNYPLISEIVDEALFRELKQKGLKEADARHLMYAICNNCDRFVTTDPDFLDRRDELKAFCGKLLISRPSELVAEMQL